MHNLSFRPALSEFLKTPSNTIGQLAPQTIIYSVSGTRRRAALAGITEEYTDWTRHQMIKCLGVLYDLGVQHVLKPMLTPSQFSETTPAYREFLWQWLDTGLQAQAFIDYCRVRKIQVHIPFIDYLPQLQNAHDTLLRKTHHVDSPLHLWIFVIPEHNILWQWALDNLLPHFPESIEEARYLLYGAQIPSATMYLDFGKPIVSPDLLPPFLAGKLECYWTQRPGYSLDDEQFRRILYDYAYVRHTWREDKTGRAEEARQFRQAWEEGPILGLGERLGPFWYPQPTIIPGMGQNGQDGEGDT